MDQQPNNNPTPNQKQPNPTVALVLGILSIVGGLFIPILGVVLGVIAMGMATKAIKAGIIDSKFKTGRILGIIGLVVSIANWIYSAIILTSALL